MLGVLAAVLLVTDGVWAYARYARPNAAITHVGLENLSMIVPASAHAAELRDGKWNSDPYQGLRLKYFDPPAGEKPKPFALVSLGSHPGLGQAIAIFRDLKARHICHVLIRESAEAFSQRFDFGRGPEASLEIPSLVLCGNGYGDAGFFGELPKDGPIHIDPDEGVPNG